MTDETLGPWIRRFLLEHVVAERNLARNTQHGYRDGFRQLIPFVARLSRRSVDRLHVRWTPETGQVVKRESSLGAAGRPRVRHVEYSEEARA